MAFDAGYADKINNALEEYRQDESEMRQNAPGAENFNTEAEGTKKPEIKKEPVDGSVEITFDPDGMTANMILHKAYNGGRPVTAAIVMAELLKKGINTGIDDLDIKDMVDGGTEKMSQEEYRKAAVDAVKQLSHDVGIPANLKDIVKPEDIPFLAQSAYDDACRPGNPRDTSVEEITELYKSLL